MPVTSDEATMMPVSHGISMRLVKILCIRNEVA